MTHSELVGEVLPLRSDVATEVVRLLSGLGVREAFGVSGGGIGPLWRALLDSPSISTLHFRHEAGAAFAAVEASLAGRRPVAVFCTTGPGITNTLTGLAAARSEGAKILLASARSSPAQRGRNAVQETPLPSADFYTPGWLFDEVFALESPDELPQIERRLRHGFDRLGAYVAHLSLPVNLQNTEVKRRSAVAHPYRLSRPSADPAVVAEVVELMTAKRFAVWVGNGARNAARQIRALVDLTGAPVLATPRGKGIVSDRHSQFLMGTGLGGHPGAFDQLELFAPDFILVLGSRLGEPSSGWDPRFVCADGFVHVDIDPAAAGTSFGSPVLAVQSDVGAFLDQLLLVAEEIPHRRFQAVSPFPQPLRYRSDTGWVRPQVVLQSLQSVVADHGIPILVEPGSAMAWAVHLLKMGNPAQLRIVGSFGSMGQMTCGVIGAAVARGGSAVCLTGDGSMLMNNEVNTAVEYNVPAVWVVLNNGRYQMCEMGMNFGPTELHARFRETDFAQIARAMGARGTRVTCEADLDTALRQALSAGGPYLIDVKVETNSKPPFDSRFRTLK